MIANTILLLKQVRGSPPDRVYPYYLHGWIYNTLRDTEIGRYYHDAKKTPFTMKDISLDEDGNLSLHIIFLDYRLMIQFFRKIYKGLQVRLGSDYFTLIETAVHPEEHPKAGMIAHESIYRLPIADRVSMNFKHTAFSSDHKTNVLPSPEMMIRSLLYKWNETSPDMIETEEEHIRQLASGMLITSHSIHTSLYHIRSDITLTTFSGRVVYKNIHKDQEMRQLLNTLMHFCHYSGVGWKCAYGMGRVDVSPILQEVPTR
jgi:CRISPR-associated endoribonuclease Cas6